MGTHLARIRRRNAIRHIPGRSGVDARLELVRAMTWKYRPNRDKAVLTAEEQEMTSDALANAPALPMRRMGRDPEKTPEFREAWRLRELEF